jgi:uncharacterized protein YjbI with pentapeptide repeats
MPWYRKVLLPATIAILCVFDPSGLAASGGCLVERSQPDTPNLFVRHLSPDCSKADRTANAVDAADVLEALQAGKGVSLKNAVLTGSLLLTQLRSVPLASLKLTDPALARLAQIGITDVRVIRGPVVIQNSVVDGIIDTQLKPDMVEHHLLGDRVVIQGPVSFTGSTFMKDVDLSRTIFLSTVDSSQAVYLGNAYFLTCVFAQATSFEKTAFAGNTRFYQSVFEGPVTFLRAGFSGLTNFLSVVFKKEVSFSRAYFKMGTGFSGSRFEGIADFSEAVFEKSAFFMNTVFASDAYFRRATFRGEVSFADAAFKGKDDFAKVFYAQQPNFTRTSFASPRSTATFENPVFLVVVAAGLLLFLIAFIIILRKG